jgi:hypothetical protein
VYINPIQEKKLLNKKQMTAIFANVDTIYEINNSLLQELEKRQARETIISRIGDLFLAQADKFKVYGAYCSSQDPRAKKVTKYKQKYVSFRFVSFSKQAFFSIESGWLWRADVAPRVCRSEGCPSSRPSASRPSCCHDAGCSSSTRSSSPRSSACASTRSYSRCALTTNI